MIQPLFALLPPALIGFFLVLWLWPLQRPTLSDFFIKGFLAVGLGLGISSCLVFVSLLILGSLRREIFWVEMALAAVFLAGAALGRVKPRQERLRTERAPISGRVLAVQRALAVGFSIALTSAIFLFIVRSLQKPHGSYDAWSIWNQGAKFLFLGAGHWRDAFSELLFHPDYPLLVPLSVARGWLWLNSETVAVPVLVALSFTAATVGLLVSSLSILRSKSQGFLAGLVLLGTPFFIHHGASQTADVPLGFFILSTFVILKFNDSSSDGCAPFVVVAGTAAGLAAWTKNEGSLVFLSILFAFFATGLKAKGWSFSLKQASFFLIGASPVLLILIYFKTQMAPPNDLVGVQNIEIVAERLTQFPRYLTTLKHIVTELFQFGGWLVSFPVLLAFYVLVVGVSISSARGPHFGTVLLSLSSIVIGWFLVYVSSAADLMFLLNSSLNRMFLQLWPSAVFAFFLIARTPERALMIEETFHQSNEMQVG